MTTEYTFFSSAYGTFTNIGHTLGHRTSLKFRRFQVMQSMISDHKGIKLPNIWKLDNAFQNSPCVKVEIKKEFRKYFELNENIICQNLWDFTKAELRNLLALNQWFSTRCGEESCAFGNTWKRHFWLSLGEMLQASHG